MANLQSQRQANRAVLFPGRTDGVILTSPLKVLDLPDESLLVI
jgi:hypothetical protein